ncbi:MAG: hypothetical protein HFJ35_07575 [Clostridia bacterium]|nr:hypothetical protein [Clostridia bacterium]
MKLIFRNQEGKGIYSFEVREQEVTLGVVVVNVKLQKPYIPQNVMKEWSDSLVKGIKEKGRQAVQAKRHYTIEELNESAKEAPGKAEEKVREIILKEAGELDKVFSEE